MIRYCLILVFLFSASGYGDTAKFEAWKKRYVAKWGKREVPRSFMQKTLAEVKPNPKVVEIDRNQLTSRKTLNYPEWIAEWLASDPHRVEEGRRMLERHKRILDQVEAGYGVDREAIVALWGVETLYGNHMGKYDVIQTLATLAFDGRRARFFEVQLFTALKILHRKHIDKEHFLGSWSGALGHCQFMPSSFTRIAVDGDGDGRKDIWTNIPDVLASIANYLKRGKWKKGASVGYLVYAPPKLKFDPDQLRTAKQYAKLGFKGEGGSALAGTWKGKAEPIPAENSPYVVRGPNYMPIMRWNNSSLFAALVINLMDRY